MPIVTYMYRCYFRKSRISHLVDEYQEKSPKRLFWGKVFFVFYCSIAALSKEQIYTHLYGYEDKGSPAAVAEHIKNIRAKLKEVGQNPIETVWGIGYKWH